jgi:hypothetical protein
VVGREERDRCRGEEDFPKGDEASVLGGNHWHLHCRHSYPDVLKAFPGEPTIPTPTNPNSTVGGSGNGAGGSTGSGNGNGKTVMGDGNCVAQGSDNTITCNSPPKQIGGVKLEANREEAIWAFNGPPSVS